MIAWVTTRKSALVLRLGNAVMSGVPWDREDRRWRRSGLRHLEVLLADLERPLRAVLGARLHEVELVVLELQIGPEGVEQIARDLLALISLQLLDQPERFLGDRD